MIADLHAHSRVSDGSLGIDELVFFAKRAGLSFLSLTDHDTMAGVTRAQVLGRRYGIEVIPGVEISCRDPQTGSRVHLLCYMPEKPDRLEGMLKRTLDRRTAAGQEMIKRVSRFYPLTPDFVARYYSSSQSIYRAHITHALADLGYDSQAFGPLYDDLFGERGGRCLVPMEYPAIEEALSLVADAQGVAVIAHPGAPDNLGLCRRLAAEGRIQGLEVYHPRNTAAVRGELLALCQTHQLLATGGTDFHGAYSPHPNPLGTCLAPPDTVARLFQMKKSILKGRE